MKKFLLSIGVVLMSVIAYAAIGQIKTAVTGKAVVKMTYVDYDDPDAAAGEVATAVAGYNKISGGTVAMAKTDWGVNKTIYLQVDLSGIKADRNIKKITLTAECSGSTDSKRATSWGVGYNTSTWSENLTYNTADRTITLCGETVSTITKSGSSFETFSWDITDAFAGGEKVATILVYETAAAGGNFKNPTVTVEEEPESTDPQSNTGVPSVTVSDIKYGDGLYFKEVTCVPTPYAEGGEDIPTIVTYTTDGSTPTAESSVYNAPIKCFKNTTIKFQAYMDFGDGEPVEDFKCEGGYYESNVTFVFDAPTISADGGHVTISTPYENATNYYSYDDVLDQAGDELTLLKTTTVSAYTKIVNGDYATFTSETATKEVTIAAPQFNTGEFVFNTDEGLAALGIEKPENGSATNLAGMTLTSGDVSMTSTDGGTATRVWCTLGATDLRMYKNGGSFTISVPEGYKIISMDFTGTECSLFGDKDEFETCTKTNTVWNAPEGESVTSKTFAATGTCKINAIKVKYLAPQATVYYSQDYENGATADWSTQVGGRFDPEIGEDADGNHYLRAAAGTRTSNGTGIYSNAYSGKLAAGTPFTMTADIHLRSANGQNGVEFAVGAAGASYDFSKWKLTGTMTLNMKQVATGGTEQWILNDDTDNPITLPGTGTLAGTNAADIYDAAPWYSIQLTWQDGLTLFSIKNKATGEVIVDKQQLKNNDSFASVGGVGQIWFSTSRYNAAFAIDNVVIRDIIDDDLPASAPNTLTAGKYEITATITANEGVDVPAEMQKYLGGYTAEGELTGDSLELVISTTEEGFILNGYEITGDAVILNDDAEVVYGDKHFQLGDAEGNTTGKLAITKTGEREYTLADGTIVYMGNVVGKVTGITFRMIDDPTTAINSVDAKAITAGKFLENGKLVILKNGVKYGVAGQIK